MLVEPDSESNIKEEEEDDEESLLQEGRRELEQAETFFPGIFPDIGLSEDDLHRYRTALGTYVAESPAEIVRTEVTHYISRKLRDLEEDSSREHLMRREHAQELCLLLGMNPVIVDLKFLATEAFQKKINFDFKKCRIVDSIFHLISQFGISNPFGEVTGGNEIEDYEERKGRLPKLRYLGVRATPVNFVPLIKSIKDILSKQGLDDCYIHGTAATNLQMVVNAGKMGISKEVKMHDFGPGLYCLKGNLEGALMYAFDRSWPKSNARDNPSVILFDTKNLPQIRESKIFHVGHAAYPMEELEYYISFCEADAKKYKDIENAQKGWSKNDLQWKHFVSASLYLGRVPSNKRLFYGLVHDSDQLGSTGTCREPQPDPDRWIQYCFPDPHFLGTNLVFVEFHIDWRDWLPTQISAEYSNFGS